MAEQGVTLQTRGRDGRMLADGAGWAARTRAAAAARLRSARTPADRLAVAVDFARAAAARAVRAGIDPAGDLDPATRAAWAAGEYLLRQIEARDV